MVRDFVSQYNDMLVTNDVQLGLIIFIVMKFKKYCNFVI